MKIGILGGTFDPVHIGHLRLAEEAWELLGLDKVLLVLSANPPHKTDRILTPFSARWKLLNLACHHNPHLVPCDLELHRPGPSFTIDTLHQIQHEHGSQTELFLLVGSDAVCEIHTWKSYLSILTLARLVVVRRAGFNSDEIDPTVREHCLFLEAPLLDISSSQIRNLLQQGRSIRYLVPEAVEQCLCGEEPLQNKAMRLDKTLRETDDCTVKAPVVFSVLEKDYGVRMKDKVL
jgi:nicotinate-nucleotide adenylyltransferase